jgi:cytoskeletal protein CcmA (bactofilin family)
MLSQNNHQDTPQQSIKSPISSSIVSSESGPALVRPSLPANAANENNAAVIGKSLVIKGEVSGSESLYIDGRVEGSINLPGNCVTVGKNGQVNATITAREVVVQGTIVGNVSVSERLKVHSEGSLTGDAAAPRISLDDGAFFKGKIDIRSSGQFTESN